MNKLGVLVDLSHCGRQTTLDGIEFSKKPVAMTHTMCDSVRSGHPRGESNIETYANHIDHAVSIAGVEHLGISTDFPPQGISPWATRENWFEPRTEFFKPSYELRWPPWIPELDTPDRYRNLVRILEGRGWTQANLERLLGLNWLRLIEETVG